MLRIKLIKTTDDRIADIDPFAAFWMQLVDRSDWLDLCVCDHEYSN